MGSLLAAASVPPRCPALPPDPLAARLTAPWPRLLAPLRPLLTPLRPLLTPLPPLLTPLPPLLTPLRLLAPQTAAATPLRPHSVYQAPDMAMLDKKSIKMENVQVGAALGLKHEEPCPCCFSGAA